MIRYLVYLLQKLLLDPRGYRQEEGIDFEESFALVRLNVPVRRIRTDNGTVFVNQTLRDYYEEVVISHETSVARSSQQNGVVERRNQAVATTCFTQNRSIVLLHHRKTPYELMYSKQPDLSFFHVFVALCYPTSDSENIAMASEQNSSGPALQEMIPGTISSGLVQKSSSSTSYVPPSRNDWDLLFNQTQSSAILQDVRNDNLDIEVAHMGNDPLLDVPITEVASVQSSSTAFPQSNVQPNHPMTHHNSKWIKDHPLNYIIGPLSKPVSTRLQLHEQALFCYYDAFLTSVEPKTYKEVLTQACWIEAMQEELHKFKRLEVWELVPNQIKSW
nr:hypothetical protein [Tanacetum cinerariifolium]